MKFAVVGLSLKLPGNINNLEDLYKTLKNKEDCVREHPSDRFNIKEFYDKDNNTGKDSLCLYACNRSLSRFHCLRAR